MIPQSGEDYCPYCRRRTKCLKDFGSRQLLCKRCGKISKLQSVSPIATEVKDNYLNWFKRRIV